MSDTPKHVQINEEGPREGFSSERPDPHRRKIELIDALSETGIDHIQVASFVNPNRVPAGRCRRVGPASNASPDRLHRAVAEREGLQRRWRPGGWTSGLVLADRVGDIPAAQPAALDGRQSACRAHDTIEEYQTARHPVRARRHHGRVRLQLRRRNPHQRVLDMIRRLLDICAEHGVAPKVFSLADTMAWATPKSIRALVGKVREQFPDDIIVASA